MSIFPILGDNLAAESRALPPYREIMADPDTGLPVFRGGVPVVAEGAEAVRLWAATALRTVRYRHEIYSQNFGCELESLIGQEFSDDVKTAEAPRMVREALLVNPYISDVSGIAVDFADGTLQISATVKTIYGEVTVRDYENL